MNLNFRINYIRNHVNGQLFIGFLVMFNHVAHSKQLFVHQRQHFRRRNCGKALHEPSRIKTQIRISEYKNVYNFLFQGVLRYFPFQKRLYSNFCAFHLLFDNIPKYNFEIGFVCILAQFLERGKKPPTRCHEILEQMAGAFVPVHLCASVITIGSMQYATFVCFTSRRAFA